MSKFLHYFLFISLLWLANAEASERWHWHDQIFKNYSVEQGLPHGAITTICEDKLGFIWLLTSKGLVRFDGANFKNVPTIVNGQEFTINSMAADKHGMIWMSSSQGLVHFDPNAREFTLFSVPANNMGKISIEESGNDTLVWGAFEQGIFKFNSRTLSVETFLEQPFLNTPDLRVFSILNAKNNTVWLGTSHGLYYKHSNDVEFSIFDLSEYLPNSLRISALLQTSDQSILVATPRNGILKLDTTLNVTQPTIANFSQEWIYTLAEVSPGLVWLGSYGKGVIQLASANKNSQRIRHNRLLDNSLANDDIWQIYRASNGLVWLASNKGLSLYNPKQNAIKTLYGDTGRANGLSDINVNSLAEDNQGQVWLGLRAKGVDVVNPTTGVIKHLAVDPSEPDNFLPGGAIETIKVDTSGKSFIGSRWGIYQYWRSKLQRLDTGERNSSSFAGALYLDNHYLWAGGTDGLWRFTLDENRVTQTKKINTANNQFTDHRITGISKTPSNELLIGTWNGLNWLDENGQVSYQFPQKNQSTAAFKAGFISSFFYDQNDRLWVGTEGAGIYVAREKFHPVNFTRIGTKQGLSSNIIRAMQADKYGRVWVSSIAGIDVIDMESFAVSALPTKEGALLPPYYRQAVIQTSEDEILFGGSGGVTIIEPKHWQPDYRFSKPVIINSMIGGVEYNDPLLGEDIAKPVLVPADQNRINIEFNTLDFIDNNAIKYRYRLLGLSEEWNITDAEHGVATYTTLPPGKYRLEIQNTNRIGQWSLKSHILHLQVLPFWYQTIIAKYLFTLLAIALIFVFIRFRTARLKKRQLFLEEQVRLRTLTLEKTAKALEEKSEALAKASVTDPLTGLNNRRFLDRNMPTEISLTQRRYHELAAEQLSISGADLIFFLIDIDHFKKINDQYGHQAGDLVLIEFSQRLKQLARDSDYLVRWGGEEFLFVVRATSRELSEKLAQRICEQVQQKPFVINKHTELTLTCSVGFVPFPFCGHNPAAMTWLECVDIADKALYTAKFSGRNAWVGVTLKPTLSVRNSVIEPLNLTLNTVDLASSRALSDVNSTWQKIK